MSDKKILWGSASAAYQVEGAFDQDGKGPSIWDRWVKLPNKTFEGTNGDIATDHYHRFKEDVALMKEMGLEAYRFSISWPRLIPNGVGDVNQAGIDFYSQLIDTLIENKIEPVVTLYHWDLPAALQDKYKGWLSRDIVSDFTHYADLCFKHFGGRVKYWIILNEPNIFTSLGYILAMHPPGHTDQKEYLQAYHNTALVHASVVKSFKEKNIPGMIGSSIAYTPGYAVSEEHWDKEAQYKYYQTVNWWHCDSYYKGSYPQWAMDYFKQLGILPEITSEDLELMAYAAQHADFIGINYYQSTTLAYNPIDGATMEKFNTDGVKGQFKESGIPGLYKNVYNPHIRYTDWDWAIDPDGLLYSLKELSDRYHKPLFISENGLGAFDVLENNEIHDSYRIDYLKEHIVRCKQSILEGVDLIAYCTWSFTDLLSWLNGFQKRYGFVYIDFLDPGLPRIKKDSFAFYQEVIRTNGDNCE